MTSFKRLKLLGERLPCALLLGMNFATKSTATEIHYVNADVNVTTSHFILTLLESLAFQAIDWWCQSMYTQRAKCRGNLCFQVMFSIMHYLASEVAREKQKRYEISRYNDTMTRDSMIDFCPIK